MTTQPSNLLGALAVVLADRVHASMENELGIGGVASAALIVIDAETGITVQALTRYLERGQSSMVRAVQELEKLSLIVKVPASDRRKLPLHVTEKGRGKIQKMLEQRASILDVALKNLPPSRINGFVATIEHLLQTLVRSPLDKYRMCRLCDEYACGPDHECPVERGAKFALRGLP